MGESFQCEPSAETPVRSAARPGILVFSRGLHLLYVNRRALELLGLRSETETTEPLHVDLGTPVIDLCTALFEALEDRLTTGRRGMFDLQKTVGDPGHRMQLRGVGLPNPEASDRSRIIVLVEDVGLVQGDGPGFLCD